MSEAQHSSLPVRNAPRSSCKNRGTSSSDCFSTSQLDWGGKISQADLLTEAKRLRLAHWKIQKDAGVDIIPSNDFALYDHVLHQIQDFGVSLRSSYESVMA